MKNKEQCQFFSFAAIRDDWQFGSAKIPFSLKKKDLW